MSGNLFLNAERELQRLETLLQVLRNYNLTLTKDKTPPINGKESKEFYHATLTFVRFNGENGYFAIDGESLPDLFQKMSDKIQNT